MMDLTPVASGAGALVRRGVPLTGPCSRNSAVSEMAITILSPPLAIFLH